ncbi:MAG: hypothetical protein KC503_14240 [Myxococcales bacterium]|nr:hypothetical protein [Myxococcales bacterium]
MALIHRQPSAGCAHCQKLGADIGCSGCGRMICAECAKTWRSCTQPKAQMMRLGLGQRLRACCAHGARGISVSLLRRHTAVDLDRLARGDERLDRKLSGALWPLVTRRGEIVEVLYSVNADPGLSLRICELEGAKLGEPGEHIGLEWTNQGPKALENSEDDALCALLRWDEAIEVFDVVERKRLTRITERGVAFVATVLHSGSDRLIGAGFQHLYIFEARSGRRIYSYALDLPFGVDWIGLANGFAMVIGSSMIVEEAPARAVCVYRLNAEGLPIETIQPLPHVFTRRRRVVAACSDDGRLIAIGNASDQPDVRGAPLLIVSRDGDCQLLAGHSDAVVFLRWVKDERGGEALVSADADNRVIIWPRSGDALVREMASRTY